MQGFFQGTLTKVFHYFKIYFIFTVKSKFSFGFPFSLVLESIFKLAGRRIYFPKFLAALVFAISSSSFFYGKNEFV